MNLEVLSPGQRKSYELVTNYLKSNPSTPISIVCDKTGAQQSVYYKARVILEDAGVLKPAPRIRTTKHRQKGEQNLKRKYTKRVKPVMHTLSVDETPTTLNQVIAFIGTTRSVVESVKELLK